MAHTCNATGCTREMTCALTDVFTFAGEAKRLIVIGYCAQHAGMLDDWRLPPHATKLYRPESLAAVA